MFVCKTAFLSDFRLDAPFRPDAGQEEGIFLLFLNTRGPREILACIFQSICVNNDNYIKVIVNTEVRQA